MVKIRLVGLPEVVQKMIEQYRNKGFNIISVSDIYPCKNSKEVRVYVTILLGGYTI